MNTIDIPGFPREGFRNRRPILSGILDDLEEEDGFNLPPDQEPEDDDTDLDVDTDELVAVDVHVHRGLI